MRLSDEKLRRFEKLDRELLEFNASRERGENPPEPEYDPAEWNEFQGWREDRLIQRARDQGLIDF